MNRTDRLYALVEELRAVSPRPRSARWLASRFEVGQRTIERDLRALVETGTPIHAVAGRSGGYALDKRRSLPPLSVTPDEAVALSAALHTLRGSPFAEPARSALHKIRAVMAPLELAEADSIVDRIVVIHDAEPARDVSRVIQSALSRSCLLELDYLDRNGTGTRRRVEPLGLLGGGAYWYLLAWCRTRDAVRGFRLDRVNEAVVLDEHVPDRDVDLKELNALGRELVGLGSDVSPNTDRTLSR